MMRASSTLQRGSGETEAQHGVVAAVSLAARLDLRVVMRSRMELAVQLMFYLVVVTLFPLAVAPEPALLEAIGPGVVWVAALLASLMALPRLFAADHADGTLEQIALSPYPLPALVSGKIVAHWLTTGLPIVVLGPIVGAQYGLDGARIAVLAAGLAVGTPILSLVGAIAAALTLGLRGGGGLLALLILPLYVPVLVFGAGAVEAVRSGLSPGANLSLLGAGLALAIVGAPLAAAAAVRIATE
ncbi:MAG TPA: heme exporter protein CcmB [Casimicrobiaceae bacterium]|nr:heme exporter protein CcmB [Casimicrobiaceae bacterium]